MQTHDIRSYVEDMKRIRYCTKCAAEEKELTSECPGSPTTYTQRNDVARGELDFKNGRWQTIVKATL